MRVVETLDRIVDEELDALPIDIRARFAHLKGLIEEVGLERIGEPHVKHLQDKLWEMRLRGRDGIARALDVTAKVRRVVVVRAFAKKTQKTPRREIELALERARRVK